ncbi:ubiquitin family protein [Entamoeba nuttalli P19]|uniref:Ubiquitin family protein n=1 Tax=Entamoeba nuttalli (strain P19) TaxID=1076696 RepID=K2GTD7_ENTNP|nr:ubiquitin family protein [Entamoeba nuttalli P19]EKE38298.1 ubiquitin family protein [Entamoeba nuttalli P19]|eukprot:XP_008859367.1 ubiquitin family protein [Entamoeba nuttalli P19]
MKINVRLTYSSNTIEIIFDDNEFNGMTVSGIKEKIRNQQPDVAEFRLIFAGRVLKDDEVLSTLGINNNVTLHLVRSRSPTSVPSQPTPSSQSTPVSQPAQPTFQSNEQSTFQQPQMGNMPLPNFGGMGGFNGMGGMDMQQTMNMLQQNPQMLEQAINFLTQNPQAMRAMLMMNPQTAQMMNNPQFSMMFDQMISNPELLRMMISNNPLMGMAGMQQPQSTQQPNFQQPQNAQQPNPFNLLFGQQPSQNSGLNQPQTAQPVQRNLHEVYANQINQLKEMGFFDEEENLRALQRVGGNVNAAVELLLQGPVY